MPTWSEIQTHTLFILLVGPYTMRLREYSHHLNGGQAATRAGERLMIALPNPSDYLMRRPSFLSIMIQVLENTSKFRPSGSAQLISLIVQRTVFMVRGLLCSDFTDPENS